MVLVLVLMRMILMSNFAYEGLGYNVYTMFATHTHAHAHMQAAEQEHFRGRRRESWNEGG